MSSQPSPITVIRPLTIWAVSDGRIGIKNQVLGLAEALAERLQNSAYEPQIVTRDIRYHPFFDRLPSALKCLPDMMLSPNSDVLSAPWPDVWISAGRATLPHALRMKKRSLGKTLVVQLQDPKANLKAFDIVIAPEHDEVKGQNVLSIIGSTHRITPEKLTFELAKWRERFAAFTPPYVAVLIGGDSKSHRLSVGRAETMAKQIKTALRSIKGTMLLTLSRRTPKDARETLLAELSDTKGIIYDNDGDNPYFAFLAVADHILVTEDSVNMITEAASTGKPIHVLNMDRKSKFGMANKFDHFHQSMQATQATRPFNGDLRPRHYTPLNETKRAAEHLYQALKLRFEDLV